MPSGFLRNGSKIIPPSRKGSKLSLSHRNAISKSNKGRKLSSETIAKMSKVQSMASWKWKGDKVKYSGLHVWIRKLLGTPKHCSYCESKVEKKYEWANISHSYRRELSDWVRLCTKCHIAYDKGNITLK